MTPLPYICITLIKTMTSPLMTSPSKTQTSYKTHSTDFTYNIANQCEISDLDVTIESLRNRRPTVTGNASKSSLSNDNNTLSSQSSSILPSLPYSHDEDHSHQLVQVGSQPFTTHEGYTIALKHIFT